LTSENDVFFVLFKKNEEGDTVGHRISSVKSAFDAEEEKKETESATQESSLDAPVDRITGISRSFITNLDVYRNFVPVLMAAPTLLGQMASDRLRKFCKDNGTVSVSEPPVENEEIYELGYLQYRQFNRLAERVYSFSRAGLHLPQVMIIGIISVYDHFLSQLLTLVFDVHEEVILTSEKTIKFSDLTKFANIGEARASIISKEVENIVRESHQEQFVWMERKFDTKLRSGLSCWPLFIELCERRNLFTHTGGVVSAQYIANCKEHKCDIGQTTAGDKLDVDPDYFLRAINVVAEIGIKLTYVLWRKFLPVEREKADAYLNDITFNLIDRREYGLAEALLAFGTDVIKRYGGEDRTRRMMIVNLANAIRLQDREDEAKAILKQEDWGATGYEYQICVAAVNGDVRKTVELIKKIGDNGAVSRDDYRQWPVFRGMRSDTNFVNAFEELFGEKLITDKTVDKDAEVSSEPKTIH
jgi:hypothetical protein